MHHKLRFLALCTLAVLTASCTDSNQPNDSASPTSAVVERLAPCASIGDRVWLDEDCEGDQDKDDTGFTEPGVPDVTVNLYTCEGGFVASTTTDANGFYVFNDVEDTGSYRVCFILPDGYSFAPVDQAGGNNGEDSDAGADGCAPCISPTECETIRGIDAGLCREDTPEPCASIGDRVWLDEDCDGFQDKDDTGYTEPGVSNVTVNLYTCTGAFVATTTTDANGAYLFSNVDDALDYRVCFVLPAGYSFAPKDQGGNNGEDSDVGADGCTDCFGVGECEEIRNIDAGLCREDTPEPCASIGDRVWFDEDCDGFQDKDDTGYTEPGVGNVTVNLYTCEGAFVATTTTDGNGAYLFSNVDDALDYRVCFVLPDGYSFAPKDQGGNNGEDSDVGPDGCTDCCGVGECEEIRNIDAGLCREDEEEGESCSPGFWKNHYTHWGPTGYSPDDIFDDVFGCEVFGDDTTLGEAIHNEITHNQLAFHGVAALLNSTHPDIDGFAYSESEVKDLVCDGNQTRLADSVTDICPLSGGNTNGGGGGKKKH